MDAARRILLASITAVVDVLAGVDMGDGSS